MNQVVRAHRNVGLIIGELSYSVSDSSHSAPSKEGLEKDNGLLSVCYLRGTSTVLTQHCRCKARILISILFVCCCCVSRQADKF